MRPVASGKEIGRTGFAGEEQSIIQGCCKIGPSMGMAR
jgi:hypothetical protein